MREFLVEIVDGRGNRSYAIVTAEDASDARNRVGIAGLGYTAQQVYPNTQAGFNDLSNQSADLRQSGLKLKDIKSFGTMPDVSDRMQPQPGDSTKGQGGFGGQGSDGSGGAIDSEINLGSVFRQFLRSTGMDPDSALGQSAFGLATPLESMLELAQGAQMNPHIPGQPFNPQGAAAFLEQRGLQGISSGASNVINQLAGANQSNAGTEMFLRPGTQGDVGATQSRGAMLAALYKMAPAWAARHGSRAIGKASDEFFDARQGGDFGSGQMADENMIRFIRDRFGGTGIFG